MPTPVRQEAAERTKAWKSLQTKDVTRRQDEAERVKARRSRQTEDVQGSDQRQEGAKRTRAWKGLKVAGQFRFGLPQDPPRLLDTMDARDRATGVEIETQWRLKGSVPRMVRSLKLTRDQPLISVSITWYRTRWR